VSAIVELLDRFQTLKSWIPVSCLTVAFLDAPHALTLTGPWQRIPLG
jgi:hypothetical protein